MKTTCGVSHLPISYGDKVRLFILAHNVRFHSHYQRFLFRGGGITQSDDVWTPYSAAISGTYDETSPIEIENLSNFNDFILSKIDLSKVTLDNDYYHDDDLITNIYLNKVNIRSPSGKNILLGIFLVHEDIYQHMISYDEPTISGYFDDTPKMPYKDMLAAEHEAWFTKYFNKMKELKAKCNLLSNENDKIECWADMHSLLLSNDDTDYLFPNSVHCKAIGNFKEQILQLIIDGSNDYNSPEAQELFSEYREFLCFYTAMENLRLQWHPPMFGGDDYPDDFHLSLNNKIKCHLQ